MAKTKDEQLQDIQDLTIQVKEAQAKCLKLAGRNACLPDYEQALNEARIERDEILHQLRLAVIKLKTSESEVESVAD